jgi:hypothetical protein
LSAYYAIIQYASLCVLLMCCVCCESITSKAQGKQDCDNQRKRERGEGREKRL